MTASNLCRVDYDGNLISGEGPLNETIFVLHSAIYRARPEIACIIHIHSRAGSAVSAMACGILPLSQTAIQFYDRVAFHDFEGIADDREERGRIAADLGDRKVLILRNHGLLTTGCTVPEAFLTMLRLEDVCRAQVDAMAARTELTLPPPAVCEETAQVFDQATTHGELVWPGLLRRLDRIDPSYKT